MSNVVYVKEKAGLGGCSMILWDTLALVYTSIYFLDLYFELHIVFCILIGLGVSLLLFLLMMVPILGTILKIACGLGITAMLYIAIDVNTNQSGKGVMQQLYENDNVMWWAVVVLFSLIFIALHFASMKGLRQSKPTYEDEDGNIYQPAPQPIPQRHPEIKIVDNSEKFCDCMQRLQDGFTAVQELCDIIGAGSDKLNIQDNEAFMKVYNDTVDRWNESSQNAQIYEDRYGSTDTISQLVIIKEFEQYIDLLNQSTNYLRRAYNKFCAENENKTVIMSESEPEMAFFKGCDTLEKLNKRYKSLAKTYHPDTEVGDTETMQEINNEYERLKAVMVDNPI